MNRDVDVEHARAALQELLNKHSDQDTHETLGALAQDARRLESAGVGDLSSAGSGRAAGAGHVLILNLNTPTQAIPPAPAFPYEGLLEETRASF